MLIMMLTMISVMFIYSDAADDADADYDAGSGDDDYDDAVARNIPLLTSDACLQALHTQYESSD